MKWVRVLCFLMLALLVLPSVAWAQEAAANIMVLRFGGQRGKQAQLRVKKVLRASGQAILPEARAPKNKTPDQFALVGSKRNVQAYIEGDVSSVDGVWTLQLRVRSGHNGELVGEPKILAPAFPSLLTNIDEQLIDVMTSALVQTSPPEGDVEEVSIDSAIPAVEEEGEDPSEAAPEPVTATVSDQEPAPVARPAKRAPRRRGRTPLFGGLNVGAVFRDLEASEAQNPFNEFQAQQGAMGVLDLVGEVYPGAFEYDGFFSNIGVRVQGEQSVGGSATISPAQPSVDVTIQSFYIGARWGVPTLRGRGDIGLNLGYGQHRTTFGFDPGIPVSDENPAPPPPPRSAGAPNGVGGAPDVDYRFLRIGVDGRFAASDVFAVNLDFGYRVIPTSGTDPGEVGGDVNEVGEPAFFPANEADGIDGGVSVDFTLAPWLLLRFGSTARLYFHDFNVTPDNQFDENGLRRPTAGGAVDFYLQGSAGLVWRVNAI